VSVERRWVSVGRVWRGGGLVGEEVGECGEERELKCVYVCMCK